MHVLLQNMSQLNQDAKADSDGAGESATPNGDVEIDMTDILSTDLSVTFKNVEPERQVNYCFFSKKNIALV